jgi:hypothetical protein
MGGFTIVGLDSPCTTVPLRAALYLVSPLDTVGG